MATTQSAHDRKSIMAVIAHPQIGLMDMDSPITKVRPGTSIMCRNIIWRGPAGNRRAENIPGTTVVTNPYLPNVGTNKCIGSFYDPINYQIYDFNWNSAGSHGIYIYDTQQQQWLVLIETGINTEGDPLAFTVANRIHAMWIIYGDSTDGNLLFFVDTQQRPRKLNIQRLLNNGYTVVKDDYLKVIKAPPVGLPQCVYENDTSVTVNNLINGLYNIVCTHLYDDFEESVLGGGANQPLPTDPFDPTNNTPATRNCRIAIYVPTGDQNVKKIRIYGKETRDGATTDWFVITTLIKSDFSIADNTYYKYLFYNNGNRIAADAGFTTLDFDRVPIKANTDCLLNGNVISYGGVTEGYNFFNPSFSIPTSNIGQAQYIRPGVLFFAALNGLFTGGQPQVTLYLTGVGNNDGSQNPTTLESQPIQLLVSAKSNGSNVGFNFINALSNPSIPFLLSSLQAAAVAAGWVFVGSTTNTLTIYYPTGTFELGTAHVEGYSIIGIPSKPPLPAFFPECAYSFGVLYRDRDGRTNGVISNLTGNIKTQPRSTVLTQIPLISISLAGFTPPLWAWYYEIVRTDNLTFAKRLEWVSDSAYSDTAQLSNTRYAYLGISNIVYYNQSIKSTQDVVSYAFSQGDRVKITARYDLNENRFALSFDYAILGVSVDPIINGQPHVGSFLQIAYPANDISGSFKFDGSDDFQQYEITIYSYKKFSAQNQNVYFQVGHQFMIGNPGTLSAYHIGNVADNKVNLTDGDIFFRQRTVPITNTYYMPMGSYDQGDQYTTIWSYAGLVNPLVDNSVFNVGGDIQRPAGLGAATFPTSASAGWIVQNKSAAQFSVRLRGNITAIEKTDPNGSFGLYVKVVLPGQAFIYLAVPEKTGLKVGDTNSFDYDITVPVPPGGKLWLVDHIILEMLIGGGQLRIDIIRNITLNVFDFSYSDIYQLNTNSDNKPNIIDTDAKQTYFSTLFRYSEAYELGTNVNNTNRFYPANMDEFNKHYGDIRRMLPWQKMVRIAQSRKWGEIGIYSKFVKNNQGTSELIVSDTIITPNNIQYYEGDFGVGNQSDSIAVNGFQVWFVDPVRGAICRLSLDGITQISEQSMIQTFAGSALPNYLINYNYQFGGVPVVLGAYNYVEDRDAEVIFVLQPGTKSPVSFVGPGSSTITQPAIFSPTGPQNIPGQTLSFNESHNGFQSFYDMAPDALICAENVLYSFYNGVMYKHTNTTTYCNFYGQQNTPQITYVYNDFGIEKKMWMAVSQVANVPWNSPLIYTETETYAGQRQESKLVDANFRLLEGLQHSALLRDIHSPGGWINGEYLKGTYIVVNWQVTDGSKFVFLSDITMRWLDSPLTAK